MLFGVRNFIKMQKKKFQTGFWYTWKSNEEMWHAQTMVESAVHLGCPAKMKKRWHIFCFFSWICDQKCFPPTQNLTVDTLWSSGYKRNNFSAFSNVRLRPLQYSNSYRTPYSTRCRRHRFLGTFITCFEIQDPKRTTLFRKFWFLVLLGPLEISNFFTISLQKGTFCTF